MTRPGSGLGIGMGLRYLGSSSLSRWACRASMRELRIASTFSSGSSAVAAPKQRNSEGGREVATGLVVIFVPKVPI